MVSRLVITLEPEERNALDELAMREIRDSRSQIRVIIIKELIRLGFLTRENVKLDRNIGEERENE